jgi:hypothetical protein
MAEHAMSDKPRCGADTKVCASCRHHLRCHDGPGHRKDFDRGDRPPCAQSTAEPCGDFSPRPCDADKLMPNGRCRQHGGMAASGMAAGPYKHGLYSDVMPASLLTHYQRAQADPEWRSLQQEIHVLRSQLRDLMAQVRDGVAVGRQVHAAAADARNAHKAVQQAQRDGARATTDEERQAAAQAFALGMTQLSEALDDLRGSLASEAQQSRLRTEVRAQALALERLERQENARMESLHNMVTAESALALQAASMRALLEVLNKHVTNADVVARIRVDAARRLKELVGRPVEGV